MGEQARSALARAEASGARLAHQPCNLARLTMEVVRDSVPRALDQHLDLGYDGAPPSAPGVWVQGNPTLLKELVRNLLDNAINYTPSSAAQPGVVTARVLADPLSQVVLLQVEDSGPGVPEAERELVFQPFTGRSATRLTARAWACPSCARSHASTARKCCSKTRTRAAARRARASRCALRRCPCSKTRPRAMLYSAAPSLARIASHIPAPMAKEKTLFTCSACGGTSPRWLGKCPSCGAWNTLVETVAEAELGKNRYSAASFTGLAQAQAVQPLAAIEARDFARTASGLEELDRVLGGGIVEGGVVLIGGDPGIGKSTLLLQALDALQRTGLPTLYVTGEESGAQVALRARRLGLEHSPVQVLAEIQLEKSSPPWTRTSPPWWWSTRSRPCIPTSSARRRARSRRCASARRTSRARPSPRAWPWCSSGT